MTDFRALCAELAEKINYTWGDIPEDVLQLMGRARAALAAPQQPPGRTGLTWAGAAQGLRDVLADQTEDAIQPVWQRSRILDALELIEANTCPPAAPQQGAPSDEEILATYKKATQEYWDSPDEQETILSVMVQKGLRAVLACYGAQAVPVPAAESLPGEADCTANPRNGEGLWCWAWIQHDPSLFTGRWRMMRREWLAEEATHWLPHWALPLPEAQP